MCVAGASGASGAGATSGLGGTLSGVNSAINAVGGAVGSIFAAQSQKTSLDLQSFFARLNAESAEDNARERLRQGEFAETRQRLQTAQIKSSQRAAMAANGVDLSTGSALDRLVSTDYIGEVDAITIRQNSVREAADSRTQASSLRSQANVTSAAAKGINPLLTGFTSLATSAGKVAQDWYRLGQSGLLSKKQSSGYGVWDARLAPGS